MQMASFVTAEILSVEFNLLRSSESACSVLMWVLPSCILLSLVHDFAYLVDSGIWRSHTRGTDHEQNNATLSFNKMIALENEAARLPLLAHCYS